MKQDLTQYNHIISLIEQGKVNEAAQKFIEYYYAFKESLSEDLGFFDFLCDFDQALKNTNDRRKFVETLNKNDKNLFTSTIKIFIDKILYKTDLNDRFHLEILDTLCKKHADNFIFFYLYASALGAVGHDTEDVSMVKKAYEMLESIAYSIPSEQINSFANRRANVLFLYLQLLPIEEVAELLDNVFLDTWISKSSFRDHFVTLHASYNLGFKLKNELQEEIKKGIGKVAATAKEYEKSHIEILGLFTAIISITVVGSGLFSRLVSLYDFLILIPVFCLGISTTYGILLFLIKPSWLRLLSAIVLLVLSGYLYFYQINKAKLKQPIKDVLSEAATF